jgi:hypothetical protein
MNDLQLEVFDLIESTLPHHQLYYISGMLRPSQARRSLPPPVQWEKERRRLAACRTVEESRAIFDSRAAAAEAAKSKATKKKGPRPSLATQLSSFVSPKGIGSDKKRNPRTCLGCGKQMAECNGAKGGRIGGKENCQHKCAGCHFGPLLCRCSWKENGGHRGLSSLVGSGSRARIGGGGGEDDDDYCLADIFPPPKKKHRARLCRQCGKTARECEGAKHRKGASQRCSFRCPGCNLGPLLCTCAPGLRHLTTPRQSTFGSKSTISSSAVFATSTNSSNPAAH